MKIVIDAGHGPGTPGKRCPDDSMREFHFNSATADFAAALLKQYENVEILFTHAEIRDVPLLERTDRANAWKADLFVSIHVNASGNDWSLARGIETFVYTTRPASAIALANAVQRQLIKLTGLVDRGIKAGDLHVLRETRMTAILCECGFMTNRDEAELLRSNAYRQKCALAIVAGIVETYGLKKNEGARDMFKDVPENHWAAGGIAAVSDPDVGLMHGYEDGTFRPDKPVTRAELAMVINRFLYRENNR